MKGYKNILVAVELNSKTDAEPLKHAEFFAKEFGADVVLVHAVEHIGSYGAYGIGVGFEIEEILIENSNKEMKKLGETIGIPEDKRIVKTGPAKFVILEEADNTEGIIAEFSGTNIMNTRPFTANSSWEVQWEFEGEIFQIYLQSPKEELWKVLANQSGSGSGSSYYPETGEYYFKVNAMGNWKIKVIEVK